MRRLYNRICEVLGFLSCYHASSGSSKGECECVCLLMCMFVCACFILLSTWWEYLSLLLIKTYRHKTVSSAFCLLSSTHSPPLLRSLTLRIWYTGLLSFLFLFVCGEKESFISMGHTRKSLHLSSFLDPPCLLPSADTIQS